MMENPALIYEYEGSSHHQSGTKPPAPLILLHDGGGTTFSYHCLYPIGRTVYGIQNSRLDEGGYWEGGIPGMARHYIKLIEKVMPDGGEIIIGGWSLGGLLSMELVSQLSTRPVTSTRPQFTVLGMIFIDSIYPKSLELVRDMPSATEGPVVKTPEELHAMSLRQKVNLNMTHARMMVARWEMPDWTGREHLIPPTILLRAKEFVSTRSEDSAEPASSDESSGTDDHDTVKKGQARSFVDYARDFKMLGWDNYGTTGGKFIQKVVDIEGHHFSIFHEDYIMDITRKIAAAADWLDEPDF
ncbi:Alpha/Beta hydrolase protein [Camillea tinctor]|nr:Alpha/Beta hydrolase protein [Camillea tinctor]